MTLQTVLYSRCCGVIGIFGHRVRHAQTVEKWARLAVTSVFLFLFFYSFTVLGTTEAEREMAEGIPSIPTAYRSSATRREKCVKELKTTRAR